MSIKSDDSNHFIDSDQTPIDDDHEEIDAFLEEDIDDVEEDIDVAEEEFDYFATKIGPAPLDYLIVVQATVLKIPMTKPVYVLCWCHPEDLHYYVSDFPVLVNGKLLPQEERQYPRESYSKVEDAAKSDFFPTIFHVDKAIDKKIEEIKMQELDTKYSPHGLRIGGGIDKTVNLFGESYNRSHPEHHEYVQIFSQDGKYTYTASHVSYARQYELGEIYQTFFGPPPEQEYFVHINSLKELIPKYSYFAYPFKILQHKMMNELLEIGVPLYETRGKKLPYDPILTSVRGAPCETADGELAEATIDINPYQRIYVIAVSVNGVEDLFISPRSFYLESMPNMYHAFDFDWPNIILKTFESRDDALHNPVYGTIYAALFKLMEGIKSEKKPYIWRNGCNDPYGFLSIAFNDGIGAELDTGTLDAHRPNNLKIMLSPSESN